MTHLPLPATPVFSLRGTLLTQLPKDLLRVERSNMYDYLWVFSQKAPFRSLVWHSVRDEGTSGETGDTEHFPLSVHDRGASRVQLCVVEKDFLSPLY